MNEVDHFREEEKCNLQSRDSWGTLHPFLSSSVTDTRDVNFGNSLTAKTKRKMFPGLWFTVSIGIKLLLK